MHVIVILLCIVADLAAIFGERTRDILEYNPGEYWFGLISVNVVLFVAVMWLRADLRQR